MNKMCFMLAFTMLSILAISPIVSAGQTYNDIWSLSNGNSVLSSDIYKRGFYPFVTDLDNIFKMLFYLLIAAIMSFTIIFSIRVFTNCKRVEY